MLNFRDFRSALCLNKAPARILLFFVVAQTAHSQDNASINTDIMSKPNHVKGANFEVNVTKAQKIKVGANQDGFRVDFQYDFKTQENVIIENVGNVPPQGKFSYIVSGNQLVFKSSSSSAPIVVDLNANVRSPEGGGIELLSESDFGNTALVGNRTATANFAESISRIFNQEFLAGYRVFQVGDIAYCISTYRVIANTPPTIRAEIAVLVSHASNITSSSFPFRFQYIVRQKPKRSSEWDYKSSGLEELVNPFIEKLLNQLDTQ